MLFEFNVVGGEFGRGEFGLGEKGATFGSRLERKDLQLAAALSLSKGSEDKDETVNEGGDDNRNCGSEFLLNE